MSRNWRSVWRTREGTTLFDGTLNSCIKSRNSGTLRHPCFNYFTIRKEVYSKDSNVSTMTCVGRNVKGNMLSDMGNYTSGIGG